MEPSRPFLGTRNPTATIPAISVSTPKWLEVLTTTFAGQGHPLDWEAPEWKLPINQERLTLTFMEEEEKVQRCR